MIKELCPNGVHYVELNEIAHYSKTRINVSLINENNYIGVENLLQNKQGKISASTIPKSKNVIGFECGDILIGNIRPYLRKIWFADCNGGTNGDVLTIQINNRKKLEPKFLYYLLSSEQFFLYDIQNSKGAKMPRGDKEVIMKYKIPVPPLEIQHEIILILDNFTELITEFTKELTVRKKQYEYYRKKIFSYEKSIPKISLYNIAISISSGKNKERLHEGKFPVFGSTGIIAKTNKPIYDHEQILIARVGNAGYVYLANGQYDVSDNTLIVDIKSEYLLKYIYYILVNMNLNQYAKGGCQPLITASQIKKLSIPIPKYDIQQRIVSILDRFDTLCNSLSNGLPAEIEARKKQYEYYRDKLLTFKELNI